MRLYNPGEDTVQEPDRLFFDYGWRYGVVSDALTAADRAITMARHPTIASVTVGFRRTMPTGHQLRVKSQLEIKDAEYFGPRLALIYFPGDRLVDGLEHPTTAVMGGPSDTVLILLRYLALSLGMKISLMDIDHHGGLVVGFKMFDPKLQLPDLAKNW